MIATIIAAVEGGGSHGAGIDWSVIANIATALGMLISGASLLAGFLLYRISKRDAFVSGFRQVLADVKTKCHKIDELITYELSHEVIASVVKAPDMDYYLQTVFEYFKANPQLANEVVTKYLKEEFPAITVPVYSGIVDKYLNIIDSLQSTIAPYQHSFPGFHRVVSPVIMLLRNYVYATKRFATDDDVWENILATMYEEEKGCFSSFECFRERLRVVFIQLLEEHVHNEDRQKDINDILQIIDMIAKAYADLNERKLYRQSKSEKNITLVPESEIETATGDLREAEKCLKSLLGQDQLLNFRELVTRVEQRM